MNNITKVSDITYLDVADYLRIAELTADDTATLQTMLGVAKAFILQYTGLPAEALDAYQDFVIAVFVLCQDMWDNRTLYVDKSNLNHVVSAILGMHAVNLL